MSPPPAGGTGGAPRKAVLLRLDPALHAALARWAADELRSTNAHVEWLLRSALERAGRLPPRSVGAAADRSQTDGTAGGG